MTSDSVKRNTEHTLFSWSPQAGLSPIDAVSAKGSYVTDRDGKTYLDFSSQLMNMNIGHGHPTVIDAIKKQLDELIFVFPGMATEPRGLLGEKLANLLPEPLTKTFFTNGGSDAIENAIKMARVYTGRQKIITKYRSYHGATYGAAAAGGDPRKHPVYRDIMPGIVHVEDPYCYRCPWGQEQSTCTKRYCTEHIERTILFEGPQTVAAILMEGESGSSGCIKYPEGYLQDVMRIAKKYNLLVIMDEVMSGFGRCGQWFGFQNHDIIPDIVVMAKGLTSGYIPLGAVTVSTDIAQFYDTTPLPCGLTYSGHAVGCQAGLATISVYESEDLIEKSRKTGEKIEAHIAKLMAKHPSIGDFRNTGMLGCLELVKNRETKEPMVPWNCPASEMGIMGDVAKKIRTLGMHTFVRWNMIFIAPPLTISDAELDEGFEILSEAISLADKAL